MKYFSFLFLYFFIIPLFQAEFVEFVKDNIQIINVAKNEVEVLLSFNILDGYHIQSTREVPENILPTEVKISNTSLYEIEKIEFASIKYEDIILGNEKHEVISGNFKLRVSLKLLENRPLDEEVLLKGVLSYQACDDMKCFYPRDLEFSAEIPSAE